MFLHQTFIWQLPVVHVVSFLINTFCWSKPVWPCFHLSQPIVTFLLDASCDGMSDEVDEIDELWWVLWLRWTLLLRKLFWTLLLRVRHVLSLLRGALN